VELPFENEDQLWAAVENLLTSEGWTGYIVPSLEATMKSDLVALSSAKRSETTSDDFLRGRIAMAGSLLNVLPAKLLEYREKANEPKAEILNADGQPVSAGDPYGENLESGQPTLEGV